MSGQQTNVWQTQGRPRHSHSASRTPQNRSGTASPSQQSQATPPRQDGGRAQQVNNLWAQRSSSASGSNGQRAEDPASSKADEQYTPANGFNAVEVKAALSKDSAHASYKIDNAGSRGSGGAWSAKPGHMANGQPFFVQLAKQAAQLEGAPGG